MTKLCIICKKYFKTPTKQTEKRKTCSKICMNILKSNLTKGRPKSEEHKHKISLAHIGKKRQPFSKEWRENMSKSRLGKKFSDSHKHKISIAQKGEKGSNWQGGKTKLRKTLSFKWVKSPEHPSANNSGYIRAHRFIMEQHLGRFLTSSEIVHHINGNPTDDRIENLMLFPSQSAHASFHAKFRN